MNVETSLSAAPAVQADLQETRRAVNALFAPGSIIELRVPKPNADESTLAGWFDDHELLAQAISELSGTRPAIYYTLNPVAPAFSIPTANKNRVAPANKTTRDSQIEKRTNLLIDFDPTRPAKTSSSEAEKMAAFQVAVAVREYLTDCGFPMPISGDSGNGGHLIYRVDLPNTSETTNVIQQFLKRLAEMFNTEGVTIDQSVFNAARITKAYGSFVGKGESTAERPHRFSGLRIIPEKLTPVTIDQLKAVAGLDKNNQPKKGTVIKAQKPKSVTSIKITQEKAERFFAFYEIEYDDAIETDEGLRWDVICPWAESHTDGRPGAAVFLKDNTLGFKCFHSHCTEQHWREYREFYESKTDGKFWFKDTLAEVTPANAPVTGTFVKKRASEVNPTAINWLWEGRIVGGKLNLFCGPPGWARAWRRWTSPPE